MSAEGWRDRASSEGTCPAPSTTVQRVGGIVRGWRAVAPSGSPTANKAGISCRPRLRCPSRDCVIGKPHRQTAALTQAGFIGRPVDDLMPLSRNVVVAILVRLERHSRHPEVKKGSALLRWARSRPYGRPCTTLDRLAGSRNQGQCHIVECL